MKRFVVLFLALLVVGCTSDINRVKTSLNDYTYYANRFEEKCPSYDSAICTELKAQADGLKKWNKAIHEAQEAVSRGGKLPLQLKALKTIEKEVAK